MRRVPHTFALAAMAALAIAAPAAAQPATWDIDSAHSAAQFAIKHMMVSTVRGDLGKISGKATYDGKDYSTVQVDASIDTTGINTREPKRDEHLKSPDFFDVSKHPTITFKSKRAEAAGAKKFRLIGDLTMHGVTKEVTLDVEASDSVTMQGKMRVGARATTKLNRKDYGITWSRAIDGGGVVVGDEVDVTLDLELTRAAT